MSEKNERDLYRTLTDTRRLLQGLDPEGERYTLESILEEFRQPQGAPAEATPPSEPSPAPQSEHSPPAPSAAEMPTEDAPVEEAAPPAAQSEVEESDFENVVAETVGAVLHEEERQHPPRRESLRHRLGRIRRERRSAAQSEEETAASQWQGEAEPAAEEYYRLLRREHTALKRRARLSLLLTAAGILVTVFAPQKLPQQTVTLLLAALLAGELLAALPILRRAGAALRERRLSAEGMIVLSAVVSVIHALAAAFDFAAGEPLCIVAALAVTVSLYAARLEMRGKMESVRLLAVGEPGTVVCESPNGILRQKGSAAGFLHGLDSVSGAERWQRVLLPVILTAVLVFSFLATLGQGRGEDFLWCVSALLTAATSLTMPLSFALPYSRVTRRLYHSGAALAGDFGARLVSRSRRMILTDRDLFPEGSVHLNGIKIYGEEIGKVVSYAASMVRRSESGLAHVFDTMLAGEGAALERVDEFLFLDEGGYSAIIHGETVLLGTETLMRHQHVALPHVLKLKNALFLAVDGQLIAAFAVKYPQVSSTEWAIHSLKRMGVAPVLASRDPNLTPALLKQRFGTDAHALYPSLEERLALSETRTRRGGLMGAVLYREGLMPYTEAVVASRRLCRASDQLTLLSLGGSVVSVLLCFYLAFVGASAVLAPLSLVLYQLLWLFCGILIGLGTDRY